MTTPTTKPSREGLKIAEALDRPGKLHRWPESDQKLAEAAAIIDAHLAPLLRIKEAAKDAHDFISVLHDATKGERQIDKNSILRYGERLKTTAAKLDEKLRAALSEAELRLSG